MHLRWWWWWWFWEVSEDLLGNFCWTLFAKRNFKLKTNWTNLLSFCIEIFRLFVLSIGNEEVFVNLSILFVSFSLDLQSHLKLCVCVLLFCRAAGPFHGTYNCNLHFDAISKIPTKLKEKKYGKRCHRSTVMMCQRCARRRKKYLQFRNIFQIKTSFGSDLSTLSVSGKNSFQFQFLSFSYCHEFQAIPKHTSSKYKLVKNWRSNKMAWN